MSDEIRISVVVRLPDMATDTTFPAKTVLLAWEAFTTAIKGTDVIVNDFHMGPSKRGRPRNRKGKPQLVATEPPTAA